MELTVLGRHSPFPPQHGACPGYLVRDAGHSLLLDCGSGVISRLQGYLDIAELNHVVLSHLHGDHCSDVSVLRYAADSDVRMGRRRSSPVTIYAPGEPRAEFEQLSYKDAVVARAVSDGDQITCGPFRVSFAETRHPLKCNAVKVRAGGSTLVYTGDTAYCQRIVELAQEADVLLAEASLEESQAGFRGHMTASESARMAREAGVKRLILTHFWPFADVDSMVDTARKHCELPVAPAVELETYRV